MRKLNRQINKRMSQAKPDLQNLALGQMIYRMIPPVPFRRIQLR